MAANPITTQMTEKPPIQYEKPPLSSKNYELRGRVVEPEHAAGMAKPTAGGVVGGMPFGTGVKNDSQPK